VNRLHATIAAVVWACTYFGVLWTRDSYLAGSVSLFGAIACYFLGYGYGLDEAESTADRYAHCGHDGSIPDTTMDIIKCNRIRCRHCGDIIESTHRHDFRSCKCGKVAVDGGTDYLRRVFPDAPPEKHFEELSEYWPAA
jgi:hypothetical protein